MSQVRTIKAEEVIVDLDAEAPDYVFDAGYRLKSLKEIEIFIKKHKHLPEVPSAKQMKNKAINLSQMSMLLLKKVEELTLHILNLEKTIKKIGRNEK